MLGAEFLLGEPVSLFGDRLACAIVAFFKNPPNKTVKLIDNFLRFRCLSGFLLQVDGDSLDMSSLFCPGHEQPRPNTATPLSANNRSVSLLNLRQGNTRSSFTSLSGSSITGSRAGLPSGGSLNKNSVSRFSSNKR